MSRGDRRVNSVRFIPDGLKLKVFALLDEGTSVELFRYYPDDLTFSAEELVGLTMAEAQELYHKKDQEYLQS